LSAAVANSKLLSVAVFRVCALRGLMTALMLLSSFCVLRVSCF
jgi:hypothetical protein